MADTNPLVAFVEKLRAERQYWERQSFTDPPEPPEMPKPNRYKLQFRPGFTPYQPAIPLEQARAQIAEKMRNYSMSKPKSILLVKAQPGVGKTHISVELAQCLAEEGKRVLYAMPTHEHYETLSKLIHFDEQYWYHWLALGTKNPNSDDTMCLYAPEMTLWAKKGYPPMKLCDSLCSIYKADCEFRRQALRSERIIAGVHNHVALGMPISDFDVAIVDELPMGAFLQPRHIPRDGIRLNAVGPVAELAEHLALLTLEERVIQGKELLDAIGPMLGDVYAQFDDYGSAIPQVPWISRADQVSNAAWWYLPDLLTLLVQEYAAWQAGQTTWLERVIVTKTGLDLLSRAEPWNALPARTIVLDATGSGTIYKQLFSRDVETYAPVVERKGSVHQVVQRLNGLSTFLETRPGDDDKTTKVRRLSKQGVEALRWCEALIERNGYERPGAVTFMGAVAEFEKVFGHGRVLHFYAQRGSNTLIDADAGFVIGTPQPNDIDVMRAVKILLPKRSRPFTFVEYDAHGKACTSLARSEELRSYNYFDERGQAERLLSGFWNDADLNAMADVQREQEIVQAIHRFRPITRDVPIWLLSSIPTSEQLTSIYETLSDALGVPEEIGNWQAWMKLVSWLAEQHAQGETVDYESIAKAAGIPEATARRWKWLDVISASMPSMWGVERLAPRSAGQPKKVLVAINNARVPIVIN